MSKAPRKRNSQSARLIFSKKPKQEDIRAVSLPLKENNAEIDTRRQQR